MVILVNTHRTSKALATIFYQHSLDLTQDHIGYISNAIETVRLDDDVASVIQRCTRGAVCEALQDRDSTPATATMDLRGGNQMLTVNRSVRGCGVGAGSHTLQEVMQNRKVKEAIV